jgi:L-2-amino-thiazoline-4-carboxylic acid hydrolase
MTLPMIERRRIEAEILREVYRAATDLVGTETAETIIGNAVRESSIAQAKSFAAQEPGGTSLKTFVDIQKYWTAENALEIQQERSDATHFEFRVTRCRYAEMYKDMGLGDIGHLLSCNRDGTFCEGYDPRLKLTRTQTIMGGASYCDFKFRYEDKGV